MKINTINSKPMKMMCVLALFLCYGADALADQFFLGCLGKLNSSYLLNMYEGKYWAWAKVDEANYNHFKYYDDNSKKSTNLVESDFIKSKNYFSLSGDHLLINGFLRNDHGFEKSTLENSVFIVSQGRDPGDLQQVAADEVMLSFPSLDRAKQFCRSLIYKCGEEIKDASGNISWAIRQHTVAHDEGSDVINVTYKFDQVAVANNNPGWHDIMVPWKNLTSDWREQPLHPSVIANNRRTQFYNCTTNMGK
jgi:hypothetical protein